MNGHALPPFHPSPARPQRLRPLDFAVLGLLSEHPSHGYELQRAFSESAELGAVIRVEAPTLYSALKELAAAGLIVGHEVRRGARPPRTEYRLTEAGRAEFEAWLRTPVERLREVRLDFLLKLYFVQRRSAQEAKSLVDEQIAACRRYLAALEEWASVLAADSWLFVVAESRVTAARGTLAWLSDYARRHSAPPAGNPRGGEKA